MTCGCKKMGGIPADQVIFDEAEDVAEVLADETLPPGAVFKLSEPKYVGRFVTIDPFASSKLQRGMVWCKNCGRTQKVDSAEKIRKGWPACCGETMTLDSPEERK